MEKKILVELYDGEDLENIISLLRGTYSAVTYVYFRYAGEPDKRDCQRLTEFVRERFGFAPRFLDIPENTIDAALERLGSLAASGFCDIDITGGSSVFIAAAGALQMKLGQERVGIHEYDVPSGVCVFRRPEQAGGQSPAADGLSVTELLKLRGVHVLNGKNDPIRYEMDGELRGEILRLWETVRGHLQSWNILSTRPGKMMETWSGLRMEKQMSDRQYEHMQPMLDKLARVGILSGLKPWNRDGTVTVSFRVDVPQSAYVLYQKGGNLLELLTCLAVEDSGCFADCCVGLTLDWEDKNGRGAPGPNNELDVVATRGHIPYFISCKNTGVENEYLYEIMTMTRHFGGKYAIPVMVSTAENTPAIRERAKEMGVILLDGVGKLTAEQFERKLHDTLCRAQHVKRNPVSPG